MSRKEKITEEEKIDVGIIIESCYSWESNFHCHFLHIVQLFQWCICSDFCIFHYSFYMLHIFESSFGIHLIMFLFDSMPLLRSLKWQTNFSFRKERFFKYGAHCDGIPMLPGLWGGVIPPFPERRMFSLEDTKGFCLLQ